MLDRLKQIFGYKPKEVPDLYDFRVIGLGQLDSFTDGLKQLKTREIDGFIVKNALSKEEVRAIDEYTRTFQAKFENVHHHPKGFVYPKPFSSLGNEILDPHSYFRQVGEVRRNFKDECGVDIEKRLFDILGKIANGREVRSPNFNQFGGSCIPYTLRYLKPNTGALEVHCGNLFQSNHNEFYRYMNETVETYDQLSYFFAIQPSESSDLVLVDRLWNDAQYKDRFDQMYTFTDEHGRLVDCSKYGVDRMTIRLEPGDFLTFAGGPIWHFVDEVKGKRGRITVGGFLAFSVDDRSINVWS